MKCPSETWLAAGQRLQRIADRICTTGSPLSPILAHFAFYDLWDEMGQLCKKDGALLTVYVDDVTMSGPALSGQLIWKVRQLIYRGGLRYHKEKHYIDHPAEITGVIASNGGVRAPHRQFKKLHEARAALRAAQEAETAALLKSKIRGNS